MKKLNILLSYLPVFIIFNWVICFLFLRNNAVYIDNYYKLNIIDSFLVGLSLIHFYFKHKYYSEFTKDYILCIFIIIFITLIYPILNENIYYFLYIFIIITIIIKSTITLWKD